MTAVVYTYFGRFLYVPPPVSAEGGGKQAWFPMMLGLEVPPSLIYYCILYIEHI